MIRAWPVLFAFLAAGSVNAQTPQRSDLDSAFTLSSIVIEADRHSCHHFDVYLAETIVQQRRGLMHVRELPRMTGMLFVYERADIRSMWMKNTYIPLDMLFIRRDGTVESIATDTVPLSLASISSGDPVHYVLELNAGVTEALGIGAGSRVHFSALD